jgi:hypothetical protein
MNKSVLIGGIIAIILIAGGLYFYSTIDNGGDGPFDNPLGYYEENIENYHEAALGLKAKIPAGNQSVYVDFSDGLVQAYSSETNKKVVDYISQKMVGSSIDWYGLGKNHNGIGKLEYANDREIYNKVISATSYVDIMAPIEEALKKISTSSNDALLITDFEEYTPNGQEQKYAYAKDYFTKWMKEGNSITIYYSQYTEKNKKSKLSGEKNLYFVLFNYGEVNENSLVSKFEKAIEGRSDLTGLNKFEINSNPYSISNNYGGKDKTGLTVDSDVEPKTALEVGDPEQAVLAVKNGFLTNKRPYESIEFGMSLNDLFEFYFKTGRRFAKGVFLDVTNNESFILKEVKVQVSDVTEDYSRYVKSKEASVSDNIPVLVKDPGNNDVWDENSLNNPITSETYVVNTLDLKPEYQYKYTPGESISEVFDFDTSIFSDRLKNSPEEVELVTTFHKNFSGKIDSSEPRILRVDYVIETTEENYNAQLEAFKWNSVINAANGVNSSLYESIRNTLQEVKPKGIVYSYYLKFEPEQ